MAELFSQGWVSTLADIGLVFLFLAVFIIFVRQTTKKSSADKSSENVQAAGTVFHTQKPGNYAEITAAISAAVNEYRKNNK